MKKLILSLLFILPTYLFGQSAGEVMFVGFNADGSDGFSFVTFVPLVNGTEIHFSDNEWNGSAIGAGGAFNDLTEFEMTWQNNTGNTISSGTVITLNNTSSAGTKTASLGTISAGTIALNATNEVLYMFLGTDNSTPTTFLSAISNENFATSGTLTNTGLTAGTNAIEFTGDEDVMLYNGSILCSSTIAACATDISNTANWTTLDGVGDQSVGVFPENVTSNFYGVVFDPVTYYSRNATLGGAWDDPNSWTTISDGSGAALAAGIYPASSDNVVILSGHTITVDAITDNQGAGISPDGLGRANVGPFTSSNINMFYQTGDILIDGTLSVTIIEAMFEGYTHISPIGTLSLNSNLVQLGYLEADASAMLSSLDDIVLTGNSVTIINTNSTSTDDLVIDHTDATLCGTGVNTLQNGVGSQINYTNFGTINQICDSFTVECIGAGCSGFPVVGTGSVITGNTGPGGIGQTDGSSNLVLWLDANTIVQGAGTNLTTWSDLSGYSNDAIAPGGNEPVYNTNQLNGFPSVAFTQANSDYLAVTDHASLNGSSVSIFGVGNMTNSSDASAGFVSKVDDSTPTQGYALLRNGTNQEVGLLIDASTNISSGAITYGTDVIMAGIYDETNVELFLNEASQGQDPFATATTASGNDLLIGATDPSPISGFLDGDIAESFVFSTSVNQAQRIIINNYLSAKYNIDISGSGNDVYTMDDSGSGDYDYEVAGIGQGSNGSNHRDAIGSGVVRMWNPNDLDNSEFLMWGHDNTLITSSSTAVDGIVIEERLSRIWRVGETGDVGTVSISFDFSILGGTAIGSDLRLLIDRDGDGFTDNDVTPITGSVINNIATFSGINFQNGDRFTLGNADATNPLPIDLYSFEAKSQLSSVLITWVTTLETNNDYFTIERSQNGFDWQQLRTVDGAGTSFEVNSYQSVDSSPLQGRSYYRLKQTDFDGQYKYSDVVFVDMFGSSELRVFPNPSTGVFTIFNLNIDVVNFRLLNAVGQTMNISITSEGSTTTIDTSHVPAGFYILQISDGFSTQSVRLIKK